MCTLPELLAYDKVGGDHTEFFALADEAQSQMRPNGFLELHFAAEVVRDTWCLSLLATLDETKYSDETNDARHKYRDQLNTSLRRNAPCPCKSGEKYKRCCGKDAPPLLNLAA